MHYEAGGGYEPGKILEASPELALVCRQLTDGTFSKGDTGLYRNLYDSLTGGSRPDEYFILADFGAYCAAQEEVGKAYRDRRRWAVMSMTNTVRSGLFSSDRTVAEYVRDIWKTEKI